MLPSYSLRKLPVAALTLSATCETPQACPAGWVGDAHKRARLAEVVQGGAGAPGTVRHEYDVNTTVCVVCNRRTTSEIV